MTPGNKRYDHLFTVIEEGLSESAKCIDTRAAVEQCYGDNISMFTSNEEISGNQKDCKTATNDANDGINMLSNLISNILENVNDRFLQANLPPIMSSEGAKLKLGIMDEVIHQFLWEQKTKQEKERLDIQSAKDAVAGTQFLSKGIDIKHIMSYHKFHMKMKLRNDLITEIEKAQKENQDLLRKVETNKRAIQETVDKVEKNVCDPLKQSADMCSFNGVS